MAALKALLSRLPAFRNGTAIHLSGRQIGDFGGTLCLSALTLRSKYAVDLAPSLRMFFQKFPEHFTLCDPGTAVVDQFCLRRPQWVVFPVLTDTHTHPPIQTHPLLVA